MFTLGALIVLIVALKLSRRPLGILWDPISEIRLMGLHPQIRPQVRTFINQAEDQGILLRITDGYRSYEEQADLYAQGRTTAGDVVTNAQPGESYHNYGLGFDVVIMREDGSANWNYKDPLWYQVGRIGELLGFNWGGAWKKPDMPHFEKSFGYSPTQLAALQNQYPNQKYLTV